MRFRDLMLNDKRGAVLLLVLATVALFTVMVVNFSADQGLDIELAYNFRDSAQAQYIARSGIEAAKAILKKDDQAYDSEDEEWGDFPEFAMAASAYLEGPVFTGSLTDESGKFDLNSLGLQNDQENSAFRRDQFMRLLEVLELDMTESEKSELAASIKDWVDTDDEETDSGAENEYYQFLDRPYECKNAPMDSPEEILLVKGMKPEYFYGTENHEGLRKYVTAGKGGTININTAPDAVLMSISGLITEDVVEEIKDCRPFMQESFECIRGLNFGDTSGDMTWIKRAVGIKSSRFSADMKGSMPSGAQVNIKAILERNNSDSVRIVYYKIY